MHAGFARSALLTAVVALGIVGFGVWLRVAAAAVPGSAVGLADRITDGGVDHAQRVEWLRALVRTAEAELGAGDVTSGGYAAAAAAELGDRASWDRLVGALAGRCSYVPHPGRLTAGPSAESARRGLESADSSVAGGSDKDHVRDVVGGPPRPLDQPLFGSAALDFLLTGYASRSRGDRARARIWFGRAAVSARLAGNALIGELAREAVD